jgi:RNA polymerase sigma-70 factor (ECF subfamily)
MTHRTLPATRGYEWDWGSVRALCLRETRRLLGSSPAADDAAQDATLRAWRHRGRCRTPATPEPWIRTIARREALRTLAQCSDLSIEDHEIADTRQEITDLADFLDVRRAVSGLDSQDRQLLVGHYWQDLPNSELAMQLGLAEVTVRVRLHRLRRRLRETLVEV